MRRLNGHTSRPTRRYTQKRATIERRPAMRRIESDYQIPGRCGRIERLVVELAARFLQSLTGDWGFQLGASGTKSCARGRGRNTERQQNAAEEKSEYPRDSTARTSRRYWWEPRRKGRERVQQGQGEEEREGEVERERERRVSGVYLVQGRGHSGRLPYVIDYYACACYYETRQFATLFLSPHQIRLPVTNGQLEVP